MKLNKKASSKNLLYASIDLTDESFIESAPTYSKKAGKVVKKMKDRYDQSMTPSNQYKNRGGLYY